MEDAKLRQLVDELIDRAHWSEFLKRFIDVLRINIFIVDYSGQIIIPPYAEGERPRYGSRFLTSSFGFDFSGKNANLLADFQPHGEYLECKDPLDFYSFAIPVKAEQKIIAYMIVGPVILNKKWSAEDYQNMAGQLGIAGHNLPDMIQEIRVVSFVTIKTILDLLAEVVRDVVELNLEKRKLHQKSEMETDILPKEITQIAQDLYTTIHLDELFVTILDVALNLTKAEGGSIMVKDENEDYFVVKVSRGLDREAAQNARVKLGEGVAGIAALENQSFVITSNEKADNRIRKYLKRPEITQSIVVPISLHNQVFGVLSLHTKQEDGHIREHAHNVKHLARLLSTAINSL